MSSDGCLPARSVLEHLESCSLPPLSHLQSLLRTYSEIQGGLRVLRKSFLEVHDAQESAHATSSITIIHVLVLVLIIIIVHHFLIRRLCLGELFPLRLTSIVRVDAGLELGIGLSTVS